MLHPPTRSIVTLYRLLLGSGPFSRAKALWLLSLRVVKRRTPLKKRPVPLSPLQKVRQAGETEKLLSPYRWTICLCRMPRAENT